MTLFKTPEPWFLPVYRVGMYRRDCPLCRPYACNTMRHPVRASRSERAVMALPKARNRFAEKRARVALIARARASWALTNVTK